MGSTTPLHALPYPASGDAFNVPVDVENLANAVDNALPIVSATAPSAPIAGTVWWNTNGAGGAPQLEIYDGSAWQVITATNPPKFISGVQTTSASPSSGAWIQVPNLGTPVLDTHNGWSAANGVYFAQVAGWYRAVMTVAWSANSTGSRGASFAVNAAQTSPAPEQMVVGAGSAICSVQGTVHAYLTVGQYLRPVMLQTSGGTLATVAAATMFTVEWDHA